MSAVATKRTKASEEADLVKRIAKAEGVSPEEATLRALRAYAQQIVTEPVMPIAPPSKTPPSSPLPKRLFLVLAGRPAVEVIGDVAIVGSSKRSDVWINQPRVETSHLRIVRDGDDYFVEDLGSEAGTTFQGKPLKRRKIENGEEYVLAGYVTVRAEFG